MISFSWCCRSILCYKSKGKQAYFSTVLTKYQQNPGDINPFNPVEDRCRKRRVKENKRKFRWSWNQETMVRNGQALASL